MKKLSRQRARQLTLKASGLCVICGKPAVKCGYCAAHYEDMKIRQRNYYRKKVGIPINAPLWTRKTALKKNDESELNKAIKKGTKAWVGVDISDIR